MISGENIQEVTDNLKLVVAAGVSRAVMDAVYVPSMICFYMCSVTLKCCITQNFQLNGKNKSKVMMK